MKYKLLRTTPAGAWHLGALVWYSQILSYPRVGHLPTRGYPGLFTSTGYWLEIQTSNHIRRIYRKRQADQLVCQGLEKLVKVLIFCFLDFMAISFYCSSSQKCYSDMNQSSDEWLRIWINFSEDNIQNSWHYNRLWNENHKLVFALMSLLMVSAITNI